MPDPGYSPNGERIDPTGAVVWQANSPPEIISEGFDIWLWFEVGVTTIPAISQTDDEPWQHVYLGG